MTHDDQKAATPEGERIAKYLARAGVASRREAEKLIEQGIVSVDGNVLTTPAFKVTPEMDIRVDGTRIGKPAAPRLWRYHKPDGLVTTHKDPQGRKNRVRRDRRPTTKSDLRWASGFNDRRAVAPNQRW